MFISILLTCCLVLGVILFGVQQFKLGSQLASVDRVSGLSHLLVRQQANLFSILLINNEKTERFTENLDNFVKEQSVIDASLYNSRGELLAQSTNSTHLRNQLGLVKQDEQQIHTQQIVEPIYSSNGIEGFLRITFDAQYTQRTQNKIDQIFNQLYGELIIVFLIGVVFSSSCHYFFRNYHQSQQGKKDTGLNRLLRPKTVQHFHRRRRRFNK